MCKLNGRASEVGGESDTQAAAAAAASTAIKCFNVNIAKVNYDACQCQVNPTVLSRRNGWMDGWSPIADCSELIPPPTTLC